MISVLEMRGDEETVVLPFSIPYEVYAREGLLQVVHRVLKKVERDGILAPHQLYITYRTDHPLSELPDFLRDTYPEQMTIVLQHQFWDLRVTEVGFSVVLSFNGAQENLSVPFNAITLFSDPSVKFGLQFEPDFTDEETPPFPPPSGNTEKTHKSSPGQKEESKVVDLETFRKK